MKVSQAERAQTWKKYMGDKPEGKCYCCGIETINFFNFEVGHNIAKSKGGRNHVDNYRPICRTCNASMGKQSIESFRAKHFAPKEQDTANKVRRTHGVQPAKKVKKKSTMSEIDRFDKRWGL